MHNSSLILGLRREILAALGSLALLSPACAGDDAGTSEATGEGTSSGTTEEGSSAGSTDASVSSTSAGSESASGTDGTAGTSVGTSEGTTSVGTSEGTTSEGTTSEGTSVGTSEGTTSRGTTSQGTTSEGTTSEGTTSEGTTGGGLCDPPPPPPEGLMQEYACFDLPDGVESCGECDDACVNYWVGAAITDDPDFCGALDLEIQCGPDPDAVPGTCCFYAAYSGIVCEGRPLIVDGEIRAAPLCERGDWLADADVPVDLRGGATRAALADAWAEDARMEHASVAAFARLVLHLMANGAPAELVAGAQSALADEVEHARLCFGLASAYRGAPVGPGPLGLDGAFAATPTLEELAVAAVVEGCVGETIAASIARVSAAQATDPAVCAALSQIAEDESRHAAFSWRLVRWALGAGGDRLRRAVADAFAAAMVEPPQARAVAVGIDVAEWGAHGRLTTEAEAEVIRDSLRAVVGPCARALLEGSRDGQLHGAPSGRPGASGLYA